MHPDDRSTSRLDQRLSELAARDPDRVAVVDETMSLTARQFDQRVDAVAARIREVAPRGAAVAVLLPRGVAAAVAPYAVWRAGCAYVPLDVTWPRNRIDHVLRTATDAVIEQSAGELTVTRRPASGRPARGEDVAYIVHTSGSTGVPKGVRISHTSLNALLDNHQRLIYQPEGVASGPVAMIASTAFDGSIERLALAAYGYTVHVPSDTVRHSPDRLIAYLTQWRIVNADFVPSHLRVLVEAGLLRRATSLKLLIVGGERFDADLWEAVVASGVRAYNVYGPSENTINTSIAKVVAGQSPTIGTPLPGVRWTIVDDDDRAVPDGEAGQLVVGGPQLSLGYVGDDALTTRAFGDLDGQRAYWTGDVVRWHADKDTLEFLGRVDDQVKINGHRVEPGEVLHALRGLPGVRDAAVTPVETTGGQRLLASVVPQDPSAPPESGELRARLGDLLPAYLVPAYWMVVPDLPMTSSLKRDHDALRAQWHAQQVGDASTPNPPGAEDLVLGIFSDVLGVPVNDRSAHFFAIGGDSLAVMRLIVRIQAATGTELDLTDIVKNPTVERLAALLVARSADGTAADVH
jgi:amino acid adenylation domain-containing protein